MRISILILGFKGLRNDDDDGREHIAKFTFFQTVSRLLIQTLSFGPTWAIFPGFQFLRTVAKFKKKTRIRQNCYVALGGFKSQSWTGRQKVY